MLSGGTYGVPLVIQDEGVSLPNSPVSTINFKGDLITASVSSGNNVDVTITTPPKTIIVQDEDSNVTNTPHTTLNFKGDAVVASDSGSGVVDITINHQTLPVYGTQFQYSVDLTESSTTATTPQSKLTLSTSSLPSGTYRITAAWLWRHSSASNDARFDITLNGTAQGTNSTMQIEPKDINSIHPAYRVFYLSLSGTNTIVLRYWSESTTTYISDTTIELIRVS